MTARAIARGTSLRRRMIVGTLRSSFFESRFSSEPLARQRMGADTWSMCSRYASQSSRCSLRNSAPAFWIAGHVARSIGPVTSIRRNVSRGTGPSLPPPPTGNSDDGRQHAAASISASEGGGASPTMAAKPRGQRDATISSDRAKRVISSIPPLPKQTVPERSSTGMEIYCHTAYSSSV